MSRLHEYDRIRLGVLSVSLLAWLALLTTSETSPHCAALSAGEEQGPLRVAEMAGAVARGWGLMLVAMMAPMLIAPLYFVYASSFARARARLMALCALGYGAMWTVAGLTLGAAQLVVTVELPASWWPALLAGPAALVWQASPWKKTCLNRCHQWAPIPAFGLSAHSGALRLGLTHGFWCVGSCWLNMLWPMLMPTGHLLAMMAVTVLAYCERLDPVAAPAWRMRGFHTAWLYLKWMSRTRRRFKAVAPWPAISR